MHIALDNLAIAKKAPAAKKIAPKGKAKSDARPKRKAA